MKTTNVTVGHFIASFLPLTENWIYSQLVNFINYRAVVVTYQKLPNSHFRFEPVYTWLPQRRPVRLAYRVVRKLLRSDINRYFVRVLEREQCRLLHAHFGPQGYEALAAKRALGVPLVTTFYGYDAGDVPNLPGWREKYERLFAEGDLFLAEGNHLKQTLVKLGCPEQKIVVQHLGVDLRKVAFSATGPSDNGQIRVLISASFVEKKGIPYALRALDKVKSAHPRISVTLMGDGPLRSEIEKLIADLRFDDIRLLGYRPHDEFLSELQKSHIFLHPSVTAANGDTEGGVPVSIIEAQATAVPVVATKHADIPEVVIDGKTGLLTEEKDVDGLAQRIKYLIDNPEERLALGKAGRVHVERHYELQTQVHKLEAIYNRLLGHAGL